MKTVVPPRRLGPYVVGNKIGGGGMASIFLGRAERPGGKEDVVALKVIRDEFRNDERFSTMFVDEAKILARLSHPNVIRTFEFGVQDDHRFIAMELLSGRTLADVWAPLVERGESVTWPLAAWICARVADGLHSAHELVDETGTPLSVVHRDVNPANIFLTYGGDVKLIDFGLAKARLRTSSSVDGIVKGKIPYLSPEQAHGIPIDRRTDVYALGTTLWEITTMKRLFKRDTDVATLRAIREAHVPDVRTIVPDVPEALWRIIERATHRESEQRYATTDDLRRDLDALLSDASGMPAALSALLARVFPGQQAQHDEWLRDVRFRESMRTIPPPTPLATASSTLLTPSEANANATERDEKASGIGGSESRRDERATNDAKATKTAGEGAEATDPPAASGRRAKGRAKGRQASRTKRTSKRVQGHGPHRAEHDSAVRAFSPSADDARARERYEATLAERERQSRRAWIAGLIAAFLLMFVTLGWALR